MPKPSSDVIPQSSYALPFLRLRFCAPVALICILGFLMVAADARVLAARQHLLRGAQDSQAALMILRHPSSLQAASSRARLRARLSAARREFGAGRGDLHLMAPVLVHLGWVPRFGSQLAAASPAADAAYNTTNALIALMDGLQPAIPLVAERRAGGGRARTLLSVLEGAQPRIETAHGDIDRALHDLRRLPETVGNPRLDSMLRQLRRWMPRLQEATTLLQLAPDLLGADHPARYLLVWENPAELRATGGFLGASDLLTVERGQVSQRFYGHQLPRELTWPPMPLPEEVYTPESTWLFVDSNWSPDFPLSARLERWFYGEDRGQWADVVVDFVDTATPDLLRATGPVYLPPYRLWVTAQNVTAEAQRIINGRYQGLQGSGVNDTVRKQFFLAVLKALLVQANRVSLDRLPVIVRAIEDMIRHHQLLLYSHRPAVESLFREAGADGRLSPGLGDYLFVVDDNRSYNKLNPYVQEKARYEVTILPTLALQATLTIHYHVAPSPANLEGGGPNWGLWGTKHDYQDFLRVYVPLGSRLSSMTGLDAWAPQIAYGATQFAGRLLVRQGKSATVVIRYQVPANVFAATHWRAYRLHIQPQPGADLHTLRVVVRGAGGISLGDEAREKVFRLPLDQDRQVRIGVGGRLTPHPIELPRLPTQPDPYIPFQYLRDPRHPL